LMPSIFAPSLTIDPQVHSSALHTPVENITITDWEDIGDDDANRHLRQNSTLNQSRALVTGTDVSHELVYLVNDHPLLPLDIQAPEDSASKQAVGIEEQQQAEQDEHPAPLAAANTPLNPLKAAPDAVTTEHEPALHDKPAAQSKATPVLHTSSLPELQSDHPTAPSADRLHHANSVHLHNDPAHTNAIPETFKGASQHDSHLSDLIAQDSLPPVGNANALDAAAPPLAVGYALPAVSELLIPAEELLITGSSETPAIASSTPLDLTDLLGGEPAASWNSHQPAMDEGVLHVMPEYTPGELEQTDLHHLY